MSLKIYSYAGNYRVWKAQIAAQYAGIDIEVDDAKDGPKSPTGKVPVLETPKGNLFESNAIARYVARLRADSGLYGQGFFEAAEVDQWIDFSANELEPARAVWLYPVRGVMVFEGKAYAGAKKDVSACLRALEKVLVKKTFLVGNAVTLADITIATALVEMFTTLFAPGFLRQFPSLVRWFTTLINQEEFANVIGEVVMAKTEKRAPKPKKVEKKAEPKKQKKQQQQPKKAKKPKNPLLCLPESKMKLDTEKKSFFKKMPFDKDYFSKKFFTETYDPEGYSFYQADYNYQEDNKILWQTQNLVGGWIQRLDALRKFGMGVVKVVSKDEETQPFKITSMWLFRGTEVPQEMKDCSDSDYYTFKKMDTSNKKDQDNIRTYFTNTEKLGNEQVHDHRFYK